MKQEDKQLSKLQAAILRSLLDGARIHGLELLSRTEDRFGKPVAGSFYKSVASLEAAGKVKSEWERKGEDPAHSGPQRRYHEITASGQASFSAYLETLEAEFNGLKAAPGQSLRPIGGN